MGRQVPLSSLLKKIETLEYYSGIKRNNAICNNMGGPRDYHTKRSKSERDKYILLFICGIRKKKETNELIFQTEGDSDTESKPMITKGRWKEG